MSRSTSMIRSSPRAPTEESCTSYGPDGLESAGADPHDLPPDGAERAVLAPVDVFPPADVLEPVPAGAVVLDRDAQLGEQDVGPHLEVLEERAPDAHRVEARCHRELREHIGAQPRFDRRGGSRCALTAERLAVRQVGCLRAQRARRLRGPRHPLPRSADRRRLREHRALGAPRRPPALTARPSRCSDGVAANVCPASHCHSSSTSAAGGICVSTMPALSSGWY